jgi:hypothetical protein
VARKPKHGSIYQRNKVWWIKYYSKGQPVYESSHSVRAEDAERLLRKRLGEIATGAYRGIAVERTTLDELFDLVGLIIAKMANGALMTYFPGSSCICGPDLGN